MLRDLTARTTLVATLYQSTHDAQQSCAEHGEIVSALAASRFEGAANLMLRHIGSVEDALGQSAGASVDARERLRASLEPLARASPRAGR
jgi:DNA-binding GntR family transcriptional regulator